MDYHSTSTKVDGIMFDSAYESEIYKVLRDFCKQTSLTLELQTKVLLKPPTKNFPAINWKCDFSITSGFSLGEIYNKPNVVLIEAKGVNSREFNRNIKMVDYLYPGIYSRMILVYQSKLGKRTGQKAFKGCNCIHSSELLQALTKSLPILLGN
jgi:hypothetical protein